MTKKSSKQPKLKLTKIDVARLSTAVPGGLEDHVTIFTNTTAAR
ncbi:MAG: hypothetical protein ACTHU0_35355 [Kofleriaceae bacterium]